MFLKTKLTFGICFLFISICLHGHPYYRHVIHTDTMGMSKVASADSVKSKTDTVAVKKNEKKNEYDELIKKGGSQLKGLFTVRHIEDKWYFEIPDSLLGRYFLAVTRLTGTPQDFGKYAGEEMNEATVYFEK